MQILKIAFRNLNRQKRRSVLLGIAVGFVFLISTLVYGMATGLLRSVENNIANLIGGHIWIGAAEKKPDVPADEKVSYTMLGQNEKELFDEILKECNVEPQSISLRTPIDGQLIFAGKKLTSVVWGVQKDEKLAWNNIVFKEGSIEGMELKNALVLSEKIATKLKLKLHDVVLFSCKNEKGQKTIVEFQLEGIAADNNIIAGGLTVFANIEYINEIYNDTRPDMFGVYFVLLKDTKMQEAYANLLEQKFRDKKLLVTDRMLARKENPTRPQSHLMKQLGEGKWDGLKYLVANMNDEAPDTMQMYIYIQLISFAIILVLLSFAMIGVANTFRMIIHERKGEIGTMRACGAKKSSVELMFSMEAIFLTVIGGVVGVVLAVLIMSVLSLIPISATSVWSMFSTAGHMRWVLSPYAVLLWFIVLILLTLFAVIVPVKRAAKMLPAEALRVGK